MNRVIVIAEGRTESAVLNQVIAPHLAMRGVALHAPVVGRARHKGGVRKFESVLHEIKALLKQETGSIVTTFFDYYALPEDWPGVKKSKGRPAQVIPSIVEPAIQEAVVREFSESFDPSRFIPYIQMYELEALLFSGPREMAQVFGLPNLETDFARIVEDCGGCEQIDDDPFSAPSKRIQKVFPSYQKGGRALAHAPRIAVRIGLDRIRAACPHFHQWLTEIERIAREVHG